MAQEYDGEPMFNPLLESGINPVVKLETERLVVVALVEVENVEVRLVGLKDPATTRFVKRPVVAKRSVAVAEAKTAKVE